MSDGRGRNVGRLPRGKSPGRSPGRTSFEPSIDEVNRRLKIENECLNNEVNKMLKLCEDQKSLFFKRELQAESLKENIVDLQAKISDLEKERSDEKVDTAESLRSLKDDHRKELRNQKKKFETTIKDLEENILLVRQQKNHYMQVRNQPFLQLVATVFVKLNNTKINIASFLRAVLCVCPHKKW